jgi:hypothetical protein
MTCMETRLRQRSLGRLEQPEDGICVCAWKAMALPQQRLLLTLMRLVHDAPPTTLSNRSMYPKIRQLPVTEAATSDMTH